MKRNSPLTAFLAVTVIALLLTIVYFVAYFATATRDGANRYFASHWSHFLFTPAVRIESVIVRHELFSSDPTWPPQEENPF